MEFDQDVIRRGNKGKKTAKGKQSRQAGKGGSMLYESYNANILIKVLANRAHSHKKHTVQKKDRTVLSLFIVLVYKNLSKNEQTRFVKKKKKKKIIMVPAMCCTVAKNSFP